MSKLETGTGSADLKAQENYIERLEADEFGWDLAIGDAFVRGMRDIGYKSTSFAVSEIVDNSQQAGASRVDVVFSEGNKPDSIAVIDNGHGMSAAMARASLIWGATHRATDGRKGFGKYGYGLPSSSVSQAERVEVYSRIKGAQWHRAYLDVIEIRDGKWTRGDRIQMPAAQEAKLPQFVAEFIDAHADAYPGGLDHGTVVVWDRLDRVDYKTRDKLRNQLVTDLGIVYRNYLREMPLSVDGVDVEPCDPLFLTPGFRYYDLDDDRATGLPPAVVEVTDKEGKRIGELRVRYARFPATFFRRPEYKKTNKPGRAGINERLEVADAHNGIIFLRHGRQIDVVRPPRWLMSINATTDRFWAVEVDFDPSLDEEFKITTSKQQVVPSERIWHILKDKGSLIAAISQMRADYAKEAAAITADIESDKEEKRAAEEAMERAEKYKPAKSSDDTEEKREERRTNFQRQVKKLAKTTGISDDEAEKQIIARQEGRKYRLETENLPGAPFYRAEQQGAQKVLFLNVSHPFFTDMYAAPDATPRVRAALEVLLWVLAEAEIESIDARRNFYERERGLWSETLRSALAELGQISSVAEAALQHDEPDAPAA